MKYYLCVLCWVLPIICYAQKQDNIWIFGSSSSNVIGQSGYQWGNTVLDFSSNDLKVYYDSIVTLDTSGSNATICDEKGNLLAYTNSMTVHNKDHKSLDGLDTIGFGSFWRNNVLTNFPNPGENWLSGYGFLQGVLFLPDPSNHDQIYCFYPNVILTDFADLIFSYEYALISFSESPTGKKVVKDIPFPAFENQRTLNRASINVCRHANGRDWWLLTQSVFLEEYYIYLLDDSGIHAHSTFTTDFTAEFDKSFTFNNFSPDGNFFAESMSFFTLNIDTAYQQTTLYNFDRCTGDFSFINRDTFIHFGLKPKAVFSPNSQYLYTSTSRALHQYDLYSTDIKGSRQQVAKYDGYAFQYHENDTPDSIYMGFMVNGPDGKIYSIPPGGSRFLHTIDYPDENNAECSFVHRSVSLPTNNFNSTPNFANYRLGPVDGSSCDTLGIDNNPVAQFRYVQDTSDYLNIRFTDNSYHEPESWEWDFGDGDTFSGKKPYFHKYDAPGIYEVCLTVSNVNDENKSCHTLHLGVSSTAKEHNSYSVNLYPNPAIDFISVIVENYLPRKSLFTMYDITGVPVMSKRLLMGNNNYYIESFPKGVYSYQITDEDKLLFTGRFIKI